MKSTFCEHGRCSNLMDPKRNKGKCCSYSCSNSMKKMKRIEIYSADPKICRECNSVIEYDQRENNFCSHSCSAKFHNKSKGSLSKATRQKISKTLKIYNTKNRKIIFSEITGLEITEQNKDLFWHNKRKHSIGLKLSKLFNIKLGLGIKTVNDLNQIKSKIHNYYDNEKLSSLEIKKIMNIDLPDGHMPAFLKQLGISLRSPSDATKNSLKKGTYNINPNPKYKNGWHIGWNQQRHFYRSSYELEIMKILDQKEWDYICESVRIEYYDSQKDSIRFAIPDIISNKILIEIKSKYTYDPINMNDKFLEYKKIGYRPILILEGKVYFSLP